MKCIICGKKINEDTCFTYHGDNNIPIPISDCCCNEHCINEYAERFEDNEPPYDVEARWQDKQDDLWERDVVFKEE